MDEIYIPIKSDDGVDLKIGMSLDEADRMAKWIAAAVHKARTGESCDDVGFVFWHARGLMPPFGGWYLVSIKTKAGYRNTDVDPYDEDYEDFENYHADVLTGWAELPEPTKSTETFQEYWVEFEEEERREQEALKKKRAAGAEDFGMRDFILSTGLIILGVLLATGIVAHLIYFAFIGLQFFIEIFSKIGAAIGSLL